MKITFNGSREELRDAIIKELSIRAAVASNGLMAAKTVRDSQFYRGEMIALQSAAQFVSWIEIAPAEGRAD